MVPQSPGLFFLFSLTYSFSVLGWRQHRMLVPSLFLLLLLSLSQVSHYYDTKRMGNFTELNMIYLFFTGTSRCFRLLPDNNMWSFVMVFCNLGGFIGINHGQSFGGNAMNHVLHNSGAWVPECPECLTPLYKVIWVRDNFNARSEARRSLKTFEVTLGQRILLTTEKLGNQLITVKGSKLPYNFILFSFLPTMSI